MFRVAIVTDVRLYREGLQRVLEQDGHLQVVHQASSVEELLAELPTRQPEAVLLDIAIPGALDAVRSSPAIRQGVKVVALGLTGNEHDVVACAEAGIAGYVCREGSVEELVQAVESALREELRCSKRIAGALLRRVASLAEHRRRERIDHLHLTSREHEVARLLDQGLTNKEISSRLFIEVSTVKNHVHSILEKLDVRTRGEAAAKLRRIGQLRPTEIGLTRRRI